MPERRERERDRERERKRKVAKTFDYMCCSRAAKEINAKKTPRKSSVKRPFVPP